MPYKDYREEIQNILKIVDGSQPSLQLGDLAIENILKASRPIEQTEKNQKTTNSPTQIHKPELSNKVDPITNMIKTYMDYYNEHEYKSEIKKLFTKYTDKNLYVVTRKLKGCTIKNIKSFMDPNATEYGYPEVIIRNYNLNTGDIVLTKKNLNPEKGPYLYDVGYRTHNESNIIEFNYAIVEKDKTLNRYYVDRNFNNEKLSDYNDKILRWYLPDYNNHKNDILNLVWYKNDPENIKIRWTLDANEPMYISPKKSSEYKNNNDKPDNHFEPTIDYNLKKQKVTIIIGDELRKELLKELIESHNGHFNMIDAFKRYNDQTFFDSQLQDTNIVIIVQNQNKHITTTTALNSIKKYDLKYAIADGAGLQQIERAIYRADNEYPAYETSYSGTYPIKK